MSERQSNFSGCSAGTRAASSATSTDVDQLSLAIGLSSQESSAELKQALQRLEDAHVTACLVGEGYSSVPPAGSRPAIDYTTAVLRGDVDTARAHGFGIAEDRTRGLAEQQPIDAELAAARDACVESTSTAFSAEYPNAALIAHLRTQIRALVAADPRTAKLDATWSACMATRGEHFAAPADVSGPFLSGALVGDRSTEVRDAVATATCIAPQVADRSKINAEVTASVIGSNQDLVRKAKGEIPKVLAEANSLASLPNTPTTSS